MRAVLKRIEETPKGPRLILSRADGMFVQALFKLEVPEIQQGIVEIRAVAREVGSRTKIAVFSRDDSIDPVGACVGLKGSRVQAVVNELGGERIDIVPWSSDPERFAKMALAPARVARVFSDQAAHTIQAVVDEDQLSLAIGRNGQNVRLASELTEWKIDLYSSREWLERGGETPLFAPLPEETEAADVRLSEIGGLGPATVAVLEEAGYHMFNDIIDLEREDLVRLPGIASEEADRIMALLDELTTDDEGSAEGGARSQAGGQASSDTGDAGEDVGSEVKAEGAEEGGADSHRETPA
jgi:N utilization substance protein A